MTNLNRVPAGSPEGGQFAAGSGAESGASLNINAGRRSPWADRLEQLESEGYVAPKASLSSKSAETIDRATFWRQAHATAEYGHEEGDYPQMSEKEVKRLTTYSGSGTSVRMPSRTAIRAFARNHNQGTVDIPVTIDHEGRSLSGWVRATPGPNGQWETEAVGFGEAQADTVAESVNAVLESRRPRSALSEATNLKQRRAERLAARNGSNAIQLQQVEGSSALTAIGHDDSDVLAVRFHDYFRKRDQKHVKAKVYGYRAPVQAAEMIMSAHSKGKAMAEIKKHSEPVSLSQCGQCKRYYSTDRPHHCPQAAQTSRAGGAVNTAGRQAAAADLRPRWGTR